MPRICLFGGSFDPIHAGHLHIAQAAQQACQLDEIVFLPAACSPFKMEHTPLLSEQQKLELLHLATKKLAWAQVSDVDLKLPRPSYSWRVVEHWLQLNPNCELFWLMGVDQWQELKRWARFDYLIDKLHFIVHHRDEAPAPRAGVRTTFLAGHHPASSSAIREAILAGKCLPDNYLVEGTGDLLRQLIF